MTQYDHEASVAIFIRTKGVTRCPTACAGHTQGLPDAADQAALERYATARNRSWRMKMARQRSGHITCDATIGPPARGCSTLTRIPLEERPAPRWRDAGPMSSPALSGDHSGRPKTVRTPPS